jgi:hypothetical protein
MSSNPAPEQEIEHGDHAKAALADGRMMAEPIPPPSADLPPRHILFAVGDCLRDRQPWRDGGDTFVPVLEVILRRLPRENPDDVRAAYYRAVLGDSVPPPEDKGRHGRLAERMRALRRPPLTRKRRGLTLTQIASTSGINRDTLVTLMQHHGYLELVYVGGTQRRRLVTDDTFRAVIGHNVWPASHRIGRLEGVGKAAPFPVFYPEELDGLLWSLNFDGIRQRVASVGHKPDRLSWLLSSHPYLPVGEVAHLSGYTRRGVEKALGRRAHGAPEDAPAYITSMRTFCVASHHEGPPLL